jgi:L-lysine 6-transaminase
MVRSTKYLEIIEEEKLLDNVKLQGKILRNELNKLAADYPDLISNVRNRGLFAAFDLINVEARSKFICASMEYGLFILPCGERSIRFRPALDIKTECILEGIEIIKKTLNDCFLR